MRGISVVAHTSFPCREIGWDIMVAKIGHERLAPDHVKRATSSALAAIIRAS